MYKASGHHRKIIMTVLIESINLHKNCEAISDNSIGLHFLMHNSYLNILGLIVTLTVTREFIIFP